ncbi:MAG: YkgJ family cysteine cluster protein [bacterium]|nr:YkgJ family cysteine cluster protein [bacterium]
MTVNPLQNLKEEILKEYPRLTPDDKFKFGCHPNVPCYNKCCQDINIFLTPYDIVRLKNRLNITSKEFLSKYTIMPTDVNQNYPIIQLKMNDTKEMECPFVTKEGCSVYEDRPWPCRMYPVGSASPSEGTGEDQFYFMMKEDVCKGFEAGNEWSIGEWLDNQEVAPYDEMGELFKEIAFHNYFIQHKKLTVKKIDFFFMAAYNLDEFKNFLNGSSFFQRFEVDDETKKKIMEDDVELLKFALNWLKFALFSEQTMTVKSNYENP